MCSVPLPDLGINAKYHFLQAYITGVHVFRRPCSTVRIQRSASGAAVMLSVVWCAGLQWSTGLHNRIAMNAAQYYGGLACGLCVMYR